MELPKRSGKVQAQLSLMIGIASVLVFGTCSKDPVKPDTNSNGTVHPVCVEFADQTADTRFNVGDVITDNGVNIEVEEFQWSNGTWTSSGYARVYDNNYAGGNGLDINSNNANLSFQFAYPGQKITLKYGEYGGNNNVKINGAFRNITDIIDLNSTTIGGAEFTISTSADTINHQGTMTIEGEITSFAIGGQELWLDDVCFTPAND